MSEVWVESTIADATSLIRNGLNCKQDKSGFGDRISRIETISDARIDPTRVGYSSLTTEQKTKYRLRPGDILFSHINSVIHVGKTAFVDRDHGIHHGVNLLLLRTTRELDPRYFEYFLKGLFWSGYWLTRCKQSVNQASVNQKDIGIVPIRYPSGLSEQQRIVAILDEAFASIATATANAGTNLESTHELFENYLTSVFNQNGADWMHTRLGHIADFKNGLNFTKNSTGARIKIVGVKDFQSNFFVPIDQLDSVQIDGTLSESFLLKKNDILTVRSNGNKRLIGRCVLTGEVPENVSHSGFTIRIRVNTEEVKPDFLVHYLKSDAVHKSLVNSGGGINISSLNQTALSGLLVRFPQQPEQIRIISEIENVKSECSYLDSIYRQKLDTLAELKQSILQKAFAGELTAQPDKALAEAGL